jgi:cell division protein FtsW (lipid II flippase)
MFPLIANALVLLTLAIAFVLEAQNPDLYYFSVQEDEFLEWSTFWAFIVAMVFYFRSAMDYRREAQRLPWFLFGVALFCFFVAMEEISWAQRVFGYRPPVYFLEHNFQQEFNIHNVVDTDYRKLALTLVIAVYGIVLPLLAAVPALKRLMDGVGIVAPTIALLPAYAATLVMYVWYPMSHSGEWVELMLGMSFLFSAMPARIRWQPVAYVAATTAVVLILGQLSAVASRAQRSAHPATMQAAHSEVEAIAIDFLTGLAHSNCNLHKRLYTFVEEYEERGLLEGSFSALQSQGLPSERAEFFLDPWNSPYWLRDRCDRASNQRIVFVYSFGPNRRRDSSRTEILGDDVGAYVHLR